MKLTDGKKTVEITMIENDMPDYSEDFFVAGMLLYVPENDVFVVGDVNYCINQACDWKNFSGYYCEDNKSAERKVNISVLKTVKAAQ